MNAVRPLEQEPIGATTRPFLVARCRHGLDGQDLAFFGKRPRRHEPGEAIELGKRGPRILVAKKLSRPPNPFGLLTQPIDRR